MVAYLFFVDLVSYLVCIVGRVHARDEGEVLVAEHVEQQLQAVGRVRRARDVQLGVQALGRLQRHAQRRQPLLHAARRRRRHLRSAPSAPAQPPHARAHRSILKVCYSVHEDVRGVSPQKQKSYYNKK